MPAPDLLPMEVHPKGHSSCLWNSSLHQRSFGKKMGGKPKLTTSEKPLPLHKDLEQKGTWEAPTLTVPFEAEMSVT